MLKIRTRLKTLTLLLAFSAVNINAEIKISADIDTVLQNHCYDCHDDEIQKGDVNLYEFPKLDHDAALELLNRMEEQVYLSQMPPKKKRQPAAAEREKLLGWISQSFESLKARSEFREKLLEPEYGNYVDHDKLFSGEIKDKPWSPSRRWLISPYIFSNKIKEIIDLPGDSSGIVNPIKLPDVSGVRDFGNRVLGGDQFITMRSNAKIISAFQLGLTDGEARKNRKNVARPFEVILKKRSAPTKEEMDAAIRHQYALVHDREPTRVEMAGCLKLMTQAVAAAGNTVGLRKMLEAVILQPDFLYRNEFGAGPKDEFGRQKLSPKDAAYAIAYALTDRRPDQPLVEAAENGRLITREDYRKQVKRLLHAEAKKQQIDLRISDNRSPSHSTAQVAKLRFFREFFGYHKAYQIFKDDKRLEGGTNRRGEHAAAIKLMINEADLLVDRILERDEDVFNQLLTTDQFYLSHNGNNQMALKISEQRRKDFDQLRRDYRRLDIKQFEKTHARKLDIYFDLKARRKFDKGQIEALKAFMNAIPKAPDHKPVVFSQALNGRLKKPMRDGHYAKDRVNLFNFDHVTWSYETRQPFKISNRMGILTHPAWLTAHSLNVSTDPVVRGKWIREKLLAGFIPDVPITVDAAIPEDHNRTLRQRLHAKTSASACWRCHEAMNPLGYAFEMYDDLGRFRTEEELEYPEHLVKEAPDIGPYTRNTYRKVALDTTGHLSGTGDEKLDGEVANALDLIARLAKSDRVRQSIIRHAFRYFMGRNEMLSDSQTLIAADQAYLNSGGSFNAVIISLLSSDSFIYRKDFQN